VLAEDFEAHGKDVIEKVRAERPHDYLKIVASLVPKQMEHAGEVPTSYVMWLPQPAETAEEWQKEYMPPTSQ